MVWISKKVTGAEEVVTKEVTLFTVLKKPVFYETKRNKKQDSSTPSLKFSHDKNVLYLVGLWVIQAYTLFERTSFTYDLYILLCVNYGSIKR